MIVALDKVSKFFGAEEILTDITLKIEDSDRIGLIGANGAGKSTLLNMLSGESEPTEGEIIFQKKRIGYLHQNAGLSGGNSILEEMRSVFSDVIRMGEKLENLYQQLSTPQGNTEENQKEYARLQTLYEQKEGYHIDIKINTVLNGMGFLGRDLSTIVDRLSGGEKTRLALAKLLLSEPDLLILDEPTNHLDFKTLGWLEEYLTAYRGAIILVSHDRYFLDRCVTDICEIYKGKLKRYRGNYSKFVVQKAQEMEYLQKEYDKQQEEIASLKDYVARNQVRASTAKSAKSRQHILDNMEVLEKPSDYLKSIHLKFTFKTEPVKDVLRVSDLELKVKDKLLNPSVNLHVRKNDKIAIVGTNGVGKTSFLKAILGEFPYSKGDILWGGGVKKSYFEQETNKLHPEKTALNELWDRFPQKYEQELRKLLGGMLLSGEDVYKKVGVLSGGEKAKVKFAIMMLEEGNVLILDEPTNHLDLSSKEVLDKALAEYEGTVIMVSHDRYLLNKVPTKIVEMKPGEMVIYDGKYDYYLEKHKEDAPAPVEKKSEKANEFYRSKKDRAEETKRKNDLRKTEAKIEEIEGEIAVLQEEIASPDIASDFEKLKEKCDLLEEKEAILNELYEKWEELSAQ
ncbi:MAG: ABC-F family ATP-binding cassette domain-containing protein [Ruminococcaceae bacterium]|nr:ABC-F family ATP-binding cassette domain-containing protein [Oscillospiraceae bacterium]